MTEEKIRKAIEVANKFNDTIFTNTVEMVAAIDTFIQLGEDYLKASAKLPSELDDSMSGIQSGWQVDAHNKCLKSCRLSLLKMCDGLEEVILIEFKKHGTDTCMDCCTDYKELASIIRQHILGGE